VHQHDGRGARPAPRHVYADPITLDEVAPVFVSVHHGVDRASNAVFEAFAHAHPLASLQQPSQIVGIFAK
jgi:hypothetical protein